MAKFSCYFYFIFAGLNLLAKAGDNEPDPEARKEFHQLKQYPFTFVPVAYLENQGPQPMRFGMPANDCSRHDPPPLPTPKPAALPEPTPTPTPKKVNAAASNDEKNLKAQAQPPALPASQTPTGENQGEPEYPPPQNGPGSAAFKQTPDEVMAYFKNPYNNSPNSHRLFDPLFEPAFVHKAPPSKATYEQQ